MKAPAFSYVRPRQLAEVLALLDRHRDEARLLAGGQTLLATLNMRLSEPALLIDLQALAELRTLQLSGKVLRVGAMVTHSAVEASPDVARHTPLLAMAAPHIAHRAIRNLGTFCGSIAYGDPAAEWPACLLALDGTVVARSVNGERRIAARDFYTGLYTTTLQPNEMIVACEIPLAAPRQRFVFDELARRHGDYAVVGLAASAEVHDGVLRQVRLAWLGTGSMPQRSLATEQALEGQAVTDTVIARAQQVLRDELQVEGDLTHTPATKQHLAGVTLKRALRVLAQQPAVQA